MQNGNTPAHLAPPGADGIGGTTNGNGTADVPASPSKESWTAPERGFRRRQTSIDLDDYFAGPRDFNKHSKWPFFMRMHGSVLPKMLLPLASVGAWATLITCISQFVYKLKVSSILLTVLGFVVGMGLSFRSSTAYERYSEGRKYWAQLMFTSQNLSRIIWLNIREREGEDATKDILHKLSALNLVVAFAVALKHKLRFEPSIHHPDLQPLVQYIDSFAKAAEDGLEKPKPKNPFKVTGEYLGISFAESNPRKFLKRSKKPIGNLPLEILKLLSAYAHKVIGNGQLVGPIYHTHMINGISTLNEVMTGTERILNTPMPIAYSIAISQITWVYVLMLPFQLWDTLRWVTIPGTIFAAYIILGLAAIGREIENPFGNDVNDLPLESFCEELMTDMDILTCTPSPDPDDFFGSPENLPLWPLSLRGMDSWSTRTGTEIREALMTKANANLTLRRSVSAARASEATEAAKEQKEDKEVHEA